MKPKLTGILPKTPTGFAGLDEVPGGGFPKGRLTLLSRYCKENLAGKHSIEVIDLLKNPQLAEGDPIFAIPTLVRKVPVPLRKIFGDLSDEEKVLVGLNIRKIEAK